MTDLSPETVGKLDQDEQWAKRQLVNLGYDYHTLPNTPQTLIEIISASVKHGRAITIDAAVTAARNTLVNHEWPPQDGDKQCDEVLDAIRALTKEPRP